MKVPRHSEGTRGMFFYLRETSPSIPAIEGNLSNMWGPEMGDQANCCLGLSTQQSKLVSERLHKTHSGGDLMRASRNLLEIILKH